MPEIASQHSRSPRMFFAVARRCDNTRSEASWASGPRSDTRPRWRPRVRFGGERKRVRYFLPFKANNPRSTFLNRASLALVLISRRIEA